MALASAMKKMKYTMPFESYRFRLTTIEMMMGVNIQLKGRAIRHLIRMPLCLSDSVSSL